MLLHPRRNRQRHLKVVRLMEEILHHFRHAGCQSAECRVPGARAPGAKVPGIFVLSACTPIRHSLRKAPRANFRSFPDARQGVHPFQFIH